MFSQKNFKTKNNINCTHDFHNFQKNDDHFPRNTIFQKMIPDVFLIRFKYSGVIKVKKYGVRGPEKSRKHENRKNEV